VCASDAPAAVLPPLPRRSLTVIVIGIAIVVLAPEEREAVLVVFSDALVVDCTSTYRMT